MIGNATYSPDDNKLRLYPFHRLSDEDFARVKAHGFRWAPRQELFVAPTWTPGREDLLVELCGEVEDDDKSLTDRAEERAERFEEYHEKRTADAQRASAAADEYAKPFANGQPILVGHHSEKRARKDQERCHNAMRRAVKAWDTAAYWTARAAGAIAHAKYKERPDVRARRIKKLEAELRKVEKNVRENKAKIAAWEAVTSHAMAYYLAGRGWFNVVKQDPPLSGHWTAYDVLRPAEERYSACPAMAWEDVKATVIKSLGRYNPERWIDHYNNRLAYERAMLAETGYIAPPKRIGRAALPLLNYAGEVIVKSLYRNPDETLTLHPITKADFAAIPNDYKGTRIAADGTHRVRIARARYVPGIEGAAMFATVGVYFTDAKQHTKPGTAPIETREQQETAARVERAQAELEANAAARAAVKAHNKAVIQGLAEPREAIAKPPAEVEAMREALKNGPPEIVVADQLFPTPPDLARRMVELAEIEPGMCVLEPSAGTGNLVRAVIEAVDTEILGYEINPKLCAHLTATFPSYRLQARCRDFLEVTDFMGCYPRVLMNPPFKNGADIEHIQHAAKFLAPGGRLVAICAGGPRQEAALRPLAKTWERLPEGTFAAAGTNVNTILLTMEG